MATATKKDDPRKIDPRKQFSKRLAGRTEWYWFLYMVLTIVAIVVAPEAALSVVYLGIMVTAVMIVSVLAYTKNSIDEKWFYWAAEIAKAINGSVNKDKDKDKSEKEDGEGGNG